jgi:hypothetical protein
MNEEDLDLIVEKYEASQEAQKASLSTTIGKQIVIYLISFFLPPFGLIYAFKYLKADDEKAKRIGQITVILTIISLLLNFWLLKTVFDSVPQLINSQMKPEDYNGLY